MNLGAEQAPEINLEEYAAETPEVSVVIPVFNERDCLVSLHGRLSVTLEHIVPFYEIVFVDDGSTDGSSDVIGALAAADERIKLLRFTRNFGQQVAIRAGLEHASGHWVAVMDADLQDPPESLSKLYSKAQEGYHVVSAIRNSRTDGLIRRSLARGFSQVFTFLTGIPYDHRLGVYRLMSAKALAAYRVVDEQRPFFAGTIYWLGFPEARVEVQHGERHSGRSNYNFPKLIQMALSWSVSFSDRPLRIVVGLGAIVTALSFALGLFILFLALALGKTVPGWASIIVSLYFLGGLIISMVGIVGLYSGRTFEETKKRPKYVVLERKNLRGLERMS